MTICTEFEFNEMLIDDMFQLINVNTSSYIIIIHLLFYVFIMINTPVIIVSIIIYEFILQK